MQFRIFCLPNIYLITLKSNNTKLLYNFVSFGVKVGLLRVFENRPMSRIFGPKRGEVTGGWRKIHNEELQDFYSSLNIIKIIKSRIM